MIQKVLITKVFRGPAETKFGTKNKIGIKTDVHGDKWLSAFIPEKFDPFKDIVEGYTAFIVVEQKGDFMNFRMPDKTDRLEARVEVLEAWMKSGAQPTANTSAPSATPEYSEADINPDDIPF